MKDEKELFAFSACNHSSSFANQEFEDRCSLSQLSVAEDFWVNQLPTLIFRIDSTRPSVRQLVRVNFLCRSTFCLTCEKAMKFQNNFRSLFVQSCALNSTGNRKNLFLKN